MEDSPRQSMFRPFEAVRVPLKLLVYGDPGTEKTRRALRMPRPVYVIDMENGACTYADLVEPGQGFYLATKSHAELSEALDELLALPEGAVGTLVIDPITVVWDSMKNGHVERMTRKKRCQAEDVFFDVGTWGKLKRTYGDLMTRLLNAPFHVVMTARGKEKIDERGATLGYGYDGEKTTMFLANVVLESHADHDMVIKDRTGTFRESLRRPRIAFSDFLSQNQTGKQAGPLETDTEAAEKDAYEEDWRQFCQALRQRGLDVATVNDWCAARGWKRPVSANPGERQRLLRILDSDAARTELASPPRPPPPPSPSSSSGAAPRPGDGAERPALRLRRSPGDQEPPPVFVRAGAGGEYRS